VVVRVVLVDISVVPDTTADGFGRMTVLWLIWREQSWLADGIHPTLRKGAKDGHPGICGLLRVERRGLGGAGGLRSTLRKGAKDGAPGGFVVC
jgi:hypothetical protein